MSRLLMPERCHRINTACSTCRDPAGQSGDGQEKSRDPEKDPGVGGTVRNGVKGNDHGEQPADDGAPCDGSQVLSNDLEDNPIAGGPERQPHANFSGSPGYGVGNHRVDSHRREAEQEWTEHHEHPRRNPAKIEVSFDVLGEGSHVVQREHGIKIAQNGSRFRGECGFIAAARPQVNLPLILWTIAIGEIHGGLRWLAESVEDGIARHADDGKSLRARLKAAAEGIRGIQVAADKLLIDDGLGGARLCLACRQSRFLPEAEFPSL